MLFFRRVMRKLGNKLLWFPQLMTIGKPADTEELAGRLSAISTVSKGDVFAVLSDLPDVMADILSNVLHFTRQRGGDQRGGERIANQGVEGGLSARTPSWGRPKNETSSRATRYGVH